jgi:hypothetical protein
VFVLGAILVVIFLIVIGWPLLLALFDVDPTTQGPRCVWLSGTMDACGVSPEPSVWSSPAGLSPWWLRSPSRPPPPAQQPVESQHP